MNNPQLTHYFKKEHYMKKFLFYIASLAILFCTSCTTITKTATSADVNNIICTYPEVADLDIQEKVSETKTWNFFPFHIGEPKLSTVKGNFIHEILKEKGGDVLLEPQFNFEKTPFGARTLTVTGYVAKYKNFRKATEADLKAIEACKGAENTTTKYNASSSKIFGIIR